MSQGNGITCSLGTAKVWSLRLCFGALNEGMSEGRFGKVISSPMMIFSIRDVLRCILRVELVSQIQLSARSDEIREISDEMSVENHEK